MKLKIIVLTCITSTSFFIQSSEDPKIDVTKSISEGQDVPHHGFIPGSTRYSMQLWLPRNPFKKVVSGGEEGIGWRHIQCHKSKDKEATCYVTSEPINRYGTRCLGFLGKEEPAWFTRLQMLHDAQEGNKPSPLEERIQSLHLVKKSYQNLLKVYEMPLFAQPDMLQCSKKRGSQEIACTYSGESFSQEASAIWYMRMKKLYKAENGLPQS